MQIKRLRINDYLCLVDFNIHFTTIHGGSSTILIGENGAGKSTILETILEIFVSFDSPAIEKEISYSYEIEYNYAEKEIKITQDNHRYRITIDGTSIEGDFHLVNIYLKDSRFFSSRIVTFYSGSNDKLLPKLRNPNMYYKKRCRHTIAEFLKEMNAEGEGTIPNFPTRKYIHMNDELTPVYLTAILCGHESFEKKYLNGTCKISKVSSANLCINVDMAEAFFGRAQFEGNHPTGLYYLSDYIDHRFTDALRRGFLYSDRGKAYFELHEIERLNIDSIAILNYFEKLATLFDTHFDVTVLQDETEIKCAQLSEGQRQLIKVLGMLGVCKSEDCLVLMDEPDAHMNPKWKYEIKEIIDEVLKQSTNTQAIIATHDPLVINGVSKEFIRIITCDNKYEFTKVIEPDTMTEGMGIDGLLQSEYYGLPTVLDSETKKKLDKKHDLFIKDKSGEITDSEATELKELTEELENMTFSRNIPTDIYYDEYVAAMHKIYSARPVVKLTKEDIEERNAMAEKILRDILEKHKNESIAQKKKAEAY